MPITVLCPSCHARFAVSEKFAGKQGPCPKCKKPITVPKLEDEIKIHEAASEPGTKDKQGRPLLKPVARKNAKFNPLMAAAAAFVALVAFGGAFVLRGIIYDNAKTIVEKDPGTKSLIDAAGIPRKKEAEMDRLISLQKQAPPIPIVIGLLILTPLLAWSGYQFLRDDEKEPYRGRGLWTRSLLCGVAYAVLWGVYALLYAFPFSIPESRPELWMWLYLGIPFLAVGTVAAWACFDLEWGDAFMHFSFFLIVTVLLRLAMGLPVA